MTNIPEFKLGIVAVSRDCFPIQLSERRRAAVVKACAQKHSLFMKPKPPLRTRRICWRLRTR